VNCPICGAAGCHYWELKRTGTWHPVPAALDHELVLPADHLSPRMYFEPQKSGASFAIALDPREACWVIANGTNVDGRRYRVSFDGWDGRVGHDGRVVVRCDPLEAPV
jgi:hypothetical protein